MTPTVDAMIKARSHDIARATKQPVGDVAQTLAALKKLADKKFGTNEDAKRKSLTADFGREISDLILQ